MCCVTELNITELNKTTVTSFIVTVIFATFQMPPSTQLHKQPQHYQTRQLVLSSTNIRITGSQLHFGRQILLDFVQIFLVHKTQVQVLALEFYLHMNFTTNNIKNTLNKKYIISYQ